MSRKPAFAGLMQALIPTDHDWLTAFSRIGVNDTEIFYLYVIDDFSMA